MNFLLSWVEHEKCFITLRPDVSSLREARGLNFGLMIFALLSSLIYIKFIGMWAGKGLVSLNICIDMPEPGLLDDKKSTKFSWIYIQSLHMQAMEGLVSVYICIDMPEPGLLDD